VQDIGEPGLPGWTINVFGPPMSLLDVQATTDANGQYCFTGLAPGTYSISESSRPGWVQTFPPSPGRYTLTVPPSATNINFGNQKIAPLLDLTNNNPISSTIPPGPGTTTPCDATDTGGATGGGATTCGAGAGPGAINNYISRRTILSGGTASFVLVVNNTSKYTDSYTLSASATNVFPSVSTTGGVSGLPGATVAFYQAKTQTESGVSCTTANLGPQIGDTGVLAAWVSGFAPSAYYVCAIVSLPLVVPGNIALTTTITSTVMSTGVAATGVVVQNGTPYPANVSGEVHNIFFQIKSTATGDVDVKLDAVSVV